MKRLKYWRFLMLLFLAIGLFQSCEKDMDDIVAPTSITDTTGTDTKDEEPDPGPNPDVGSGEQGGDSDNDPPAEGDPGSITLYSVEGGNLIKQKDFKVSGKELELQKDTNKHQEIWELTKKIIPPNYLSKMSEFMIFAGEGDGTAGYVFNTATDLSKWQMGIAIDFAYEGGFNAGGELAYTIIHEFGHILTLDNTQVDASVSEDKCENYFVGEGCARTSSYINKTYKKGWADIWDAFLKVRDAESESASEEFYNKYRDRFVTGYASTNPGEDIAEVFATFVTRNGGVNGSTIAEQKIQIMYDHPELIELRNFIRGNTATAKGRSYLPVAGSWKKAATFGNPKKSHCSRPAK